MKGPMLVMKMKEWKMLTKWLNNAILSGDTARVAELKQMQREDQLSYLNYLESLPSRFGNSYGSLEYSLDKSNVINYYSKWERENVYFAKESLKRTKQYEKREGLRPFMVIKEDIKKANKLKRLNEVEGMYYRD